MVHALHVMQVSKHFCQAGHFHQNVNDSIPTDIICHTTFLPHIQQIPIPLRCHNNDLLYKGGTLKCNIYSLKGKTGFGETFMRLLELQLKLPG